MRKRFKLFVVGAVISAATTLALPVLAQTPAPELQQPPNAIDPPKVEPQKPVEAPADLPKPPVGDRRINIDRLFQALKIAPDDASAKYIENRIWSLWTAAGGDTANLLMGRVKVAVDGKDLDLAIRLLTAIIEIRPDYVEARNRRATIYFTKHDFEHSLADIHDVLAREPRHFGALSGLGMILQEVGDDKAALEAFRRALAVHPHLERIPDMVKKLTEKVEGRDI
jgi:tetratricopeptide (TPR) repeat protein